MEKYRRQLSDVDRIPPTQILGLFYLKLNLLKNVAKPTCESLLLLVEKTIVKLVLRINIVDMKYRFVYCTINLFNRVGKHLVNELTDEIKETIKYLHTSPSTAAQHVEYKKFLETFSKRVCIF